MLVRPEADEDIAAIRAVNVASFPSDDEARLVDALRADGDLSVSLVAVVDDVVVGHVAFSPVTAGAHRGMGLAPVAVLERHRRRGIAEQLIRSGLDRCRDSGCRFVVVLGAPAYYARFGFEPARPHGLVDAYEGGDAFQVMPLTEGGIPPASEVAYAAAFATVA